MEDPPIILEHDSSEIEIVCRSKSIAQRKSCSTSSASSVSSPIPIMLHDDLDIGIEREEEVDRLEEPGFEYNVQDIVRIKEEGIVPENEEIRSESEEHGESISQKSGKTTSFPRPKLISKVDLMDTQYCSFQDRSYCSNCYEKLSYDNQGKKFGDILYRRRAKSELGSDQVLVVTVLEALDAIFELNRNSFLSDIILDETEYSICWKCCCMLSKLYKLFIEFADTSRSPSYIKSIITHNRSLYPHQNSNKKCIKTSDGQRDEVDEENGGNEFDGSGSVTEVTHSKRNEPTLVGRQRIRIPRMTIRKRRTCPEAKCGYIFTRTNHLKAHLRSKHKIEPGPGPPLPKEPQTCPVCNLVVKSKSRLDTHLQKHRPLIRKSNHECDICGKKYRDANNLRNHKTSHRLDKPYICDKCGFATKRSYQLTRHIQMVHVGTRSHLCTECGQSFKKKQHLRDHEATHNTMEYRPYTCTMEGCTKAYRSRRNLRQHLEAHTGCKFQCETCGRIFTRKDNLKVHVDTAHLGKPGRNQKEKPQGEGGTLPPKKPRKPKQTVSTVEHNILILPDDGPASDKEVVGQTHQVMILDEANLQQLQQQQFHHILTTNPRIIQQGAVAGQSVVAIPNPFGEFFYTI